MIRIIPMEKSTVEAVAVLSRACFSQPWSYEAILGELTNPRAVTFTALEEESLAGFVSAYTVLDEGYINNIAVRKESRKKGVGSQLLSALIQEGIRQGLAFWSLEVRESNAEAIRFYEKHGFRRVGRRSDFYEQPREAALLYTLMLSKEGTKY
jgi:ribosomal-protein-alanine N-acetyltransferase